MMKHQISTLLIALATLAVSPAMAETAAPAKKVVKKAPAKKAAAAAPAKDEPIGDDEDSKEPSIVGSAVTEFHCELGNKLTIYKNEGDDKYMALRWANRIHRMTRVGTTTGANRFENKKTGLVWIGIPAKGILLNAKIGQQLANECKDPEQMKPKAVVAPGPALIAPTPAPVEAPKAPAAAS